MDHPIKRPTYDEHIGQLFTPGDVACMNWALDLQTYEGVRRDASKISDWIGSGRMPPPDTGRQWSAEKLQTFRNWGDNTGFAERRMVRLTPSAEPRLRKSIHDIKKGDDAHKLLVKAFEGMMARDGDLDDPTSFFNVAGLHWLPGPRTNTFCRHHDDAYNPWHRAYLMAFEDAMRSVDGCAEVTLPYWDILGDQLPDWVYEPPFYPYALPHKLTNLDGSQSWDAGYLTERDSAAQILQNVADAHDNIGTKIGEALASDTWTGFNGWSDWPNQHEGIIRAHDNGHGACGDTVANQDIAAFDPLFWFFHCNWDRLWWQWQTSKNLTTLAEFKTVVSGDTRWLEDSPETLLAPFDVNSGEMIDLSHWNIDYQHPPEQPILFDKMLLSATGHSPAAAAFFLPTTERFSVRVKGINRLNIPGSFEVVLFEGTRVLRKTRIFQPSTPNECDNCRKHGVFSTDFIVDKADLPDQASLRIGIRARNAEGAMDDFPLERAGNPSVNVRLLVQPV